MIRARFVRRQGDLVSVVCKGHAGFADYGNDIVCSATSALCGAVLNGITEVLHIEPDFSIDEDGFLSISMENLPENQMRACQVLMETLLLGLENIEISYGEYINVKVEEVQ